MNGFGTCGARRKSWGQQPGLCLVRVPLSYVILWSPTQSLTHTHTHTHTRIALHTPSPVLPHTFEQAHHRWEGQALFARRLDFLGGRHQAPLLFARLLKPLVHRLAHVRYNLIVTSSFCFITTHCHSLPLITKCSRCHLAGRSSKTNDREWFTHTLLPSPLLLSLFTLPSSSPHRSLAALGVPRGPPPSAASIRPPSKALGAPPGPRTLHVKCRYSYGVFTFCSVTASAVFSFVACSFCAMLSRP